MAGYEKDTIQGLVSNLSRRIMYQKKKYFKMYFIYVQGHLIRIVLSLADSEYLGRHPWVLPK